MKKCTQVHYSWYIRIHPFRIIRLWLTHSILLKESSNYVIWMKRCTASVENEFACAVLYVFSRCMENHAQRSQRYIQFLFNFHLLQKYRKNIYFINYKILNIDYGIRCHFMGERTKFETPEIESNPISDTYGASLVSIHWRVHFSVSPHVLVLFLSLNRLIFAPIGRFSRFIRYPFSYLQEHVWFTIFDSLRKYSYLKKTVRNGFIY